MDAPREHLDGPRDWRIYSTYRVLILQMDVPLVQVAGISDAIMAGECSPILFLYSNNCKGATERSPAVPADKNRDDLEALPLPANVEMLQKESLKKFTLFHQCVTAAKQCCSTALCELFRSFHCSSPFFRGCVVGGAPLDPLLGQSPSAQQQF
jgi:hypothetical protein